MKKKIVLSSIATLGVLSLVGCGGSGSSNATVATGKSFYLDSAVSGINYKCGAQEGITDAEGAFTFDVGSSCTFYLGDIMLRNVAANTLKDGESIVETDVKIAQLLQTLDVDGDPSNGITVSPEVVDAMHTALNADGGNGTLPDTQEELQALSAALEEVPGYTGHAVTEADAEAHLATTAASVGAQKMKTLLSGKTIYIPNLDGTVFEVKFNDTLTTQTYTEDGQVKTDPLQLDGEKIYVDDNEYIVFVEDKGDYLLFDEFQNEIKQAPIRIYFDKTKAKAYANEAFSALIIGKTYYNPVEDSYTDANGALVNNNHVETLAFGTDGKLDITWMEDGQQNEVVMDYTINNNTVTIAKPNGDIVSSFMIAGQSNGSIQLTDANGQDSGRFFLTEAAAAAAL